MTKMTVRASLSSQRTTGRTVLVCCGEDAAARLLATELAASGHRMIVAQGGNGALEHLRNEEIDAMVVEVAIAQGHAYHLLRSIRQNPTTEALPIVVVGAKVPDPTANVYEAGADLFFVEPFLEDLLRVLT